MMGSLNIHHLGQHAESCALQFLEAKGLRLLAKNFKTKGGEIDLIMQEGETIVFIEVRTRQHPDYPNAIESVDPVKLRKVYRTAVYYLQGRDWFDKVPCRIDIVGIEGKSGQLIWIKNVFEV